MARFASSFLPTKSLIAIFCHVADSEFPKAALMWLRSRTLRDLERYFLDRPLFRQALRLGRPIGFSSQFRMPIRAPTIYGIGKPCLLQRTWEWPPRQFAPLAGGLFLRGQWQIPDKSLGFTKGFLARDPDGHGLQLIEK
jgi:hypothetical protein